MYLVNPIISLTELSDKYVWIFYIAANSNTIKKAIDAQQQWQMAEYINSNIIQMNYCMKSAYKSVANYPGEYTTILINLLFYCIY